MIITQLNGGLGNQMFQYALGRHLAEKNSSILKLDLSFLESYKHRKYGLYCFNIHEHIASIEEINIFKKNANRLSISVGRISNKLGLNFFITPFYYRNSYVIEEKSDDFDPSVLEAVGNIYLKGYWQSEKYFIDIKEILLKEFTIKYKMDSVNYEILKSIVKNVSIAVHFRRGDYVDKDDVKKVHGTCSMNYYRKAIDYMRAKEPEACFYAFSDDPKWVKENFIIEAPFNVIDHNDASSHYEDLRLMSHCKHHIIANSSFSWWAAWLSQNPDKVVIAPKGWFNKEVDIASRFPDGWVLF